MTTTFVHLEIAAVLAAHAPCRPECIENECQHVTIGQPATWVVRLAGIDDFVCEACYQMHYNQNEACTVAWEAEPISAVVEETRGDSAPVSLLTANHSPLSLAFEQAERELGARIGYPALVYHKVERSGDSRYWMAPTDIMDEDRPLRDTDLVDRLNEQDDDLSRARDKNATIWAACVAQEDEIAQLRAELATSDAHIGALLASGGRLRVEALEHVSTGRGAMHVQLACEDAEPALNAARTWLRRGATKV